MISQTTSIATGSGSIGGELVGEVRTFQQLQCLSVIFLIFEGGFGASAFLLLVFALSMEFHYLKEWQGFCPNHLYTVYFQPPELEYCSRFVIVIVAPLHCAHC